MNPRVAVVWLTTAAVMLPCCFMQAADLYVAPDGTPSGPGTIRKPYDVMSALCGSVARPGETVWLRGGCYPIGHVSTKIHGAIGRPITFRSTPGERVQLVGSLTLWGEGGEVTLRGFELSSGTTKRVSRQTGVGFSPTDLPNFREGIQVYAPNCSFINLVVHDSVRSGFYTSPQATNTLIYGCIVYNTGWASPDNAEGHSFYLQGAGEITDNVCFNSTGANFHVYANGSGCSLQDLTLDGNVAFGAGALQAVRPYRDWIVGVDSPALKADRMVLRRNMGYVTSNPLILRQVQIGRERRNGSLVLSSNYWPAGVVVQNWTSAEVSDNTFAPQNTEPVVELHENLTRLHATWNSNAYTHASNGGEFHIDGHRYCFAEWKHVTGYDSASSRTAAPLTGTQVFVRPNRYEAGRAHIVVYNWNQLSKVAVNVCSVLSAGDVYEIRNAQDFFAPPVLSGTFDGQPLQLPMTGLTVAKPLAGLKTPPPTGPTFNVFELLCSGKKSAIGTPAATQRS
jgi:hypothetical protein